MIRVFLDANIIFSAAYREESGLAQIWIKEGLALVTSDYAISEAERNIAAKRPIALERLRLLVSQLEVIAESSTIMGDYGLPYKDQPILAAALNSNCSVLLTGDMTHFGHLIGKSVENILILTPGLFLQKY